MEHLVYVSVTIFTNTISLQETKKLQKEQSKYKLEIQKLLDERDHLMDVINVHRAVCPKFRCKSSAI